MRLLMLPLLLLLLLVLLLVFSSFHFSFFYCNLMLLNVSCVWCGSLWSVFVCACCCCVCLVCVWRNVRFRFKMIQEIYGVVHRKPWRTHTHTPPRWFIFSTEWNFDLFLSRRLLSWSSWYVYGLCECVCIRWMVDVIRFIVLIYFIVLVVIISAESIDSLWSITPIIQNYNFSLKEFRKFFFSFGFASSSVGNIIVRSLDAIVSDDNNVILVVTESLIVRRVCGEREKNLRFRLIRERKTIQN